MDNIITSSPEENLNYLIDSQAQRRFIDTPMNETVSAVEHEFHIPTIKEITPYLYAHTAVNQTKLWEQSYRRLRRVEKQAFIEHLVTLEHLHVIHRIPRGQGKRYGGTGRCTMILLSEDMTIRWIDYQCVLAHHREVTGQGHGFMNSKSVIVQARLTATLSVYQDILQTALKMQQHSA